jgi:hypothetical protein
LPTFEQIRSRACAARAGEHPVSVAAGGGFWMVCAVCELAGGPHTTGVETSCLVGVHDRLHHGGRSTAVVTECPVCESCRQAPAAVTWSHPGAGAPFLLCRTCAPTDAFTAAGGEG